MTYDEAVEHLVARVKLLSFRSAEDQEALEVLEHCNCKEDFTDGTAYCQNCGKKSSS